MENVSERIVRNIIDDMTERQAMRQTWYAIDINIRREIRERWERITRDELLRMLESRS